MSQSEKQYHHFQSRLMRQLNNYGFNKRKRTQSFSFQKSFSNKQNINNRRQTQATHLMIIRVCSDVSQPIQSMIKISNKEQNIETNKTQILCKKRILQNLLHLEQTQRNLSKNQEYFQNNINMQINSNKVLKQSNLNIKRNFTKTLGCKSWIKPSFSLGMIALKPLSLNTLSKKNKINTQSKKYQALHDLNKKISNMWKSWNQKNKKQKTTKQQQTFQ